MADIGCLPSKTTVTISSSTGERGVVPAATETAAGCMTADHVVRLETLWHRGESASSSGPLIIQHRQTPGDVVSRDQFRAAVDGLRRLVLDQQVHTVPLLPQDGSGTLLDRVGQLEMAADNIDARLSAMAEAVAGLMDHLDEVKRGLDARLDDHERSMPSIDGIKMIRGAA